VAILGVVFFKALGSAPDLSTYTSAILPMLVFNLALLTGALLLTRLLAPERQDQVGILARIRELADSMAA
jgi:lipid-A-disaccharide synthase-like uncharacterized protein